jgi:hypothetical protein
VKAPAPRGLSIFAGDVILVRPVRFKGAILACFFDPSENPKA